jgi:hypothetical protein
MKTLMKPAMGLTESGYEEMKEKFADEVIKFKSFFKAYRIYAKKV